MPDSGFLHKYFLSNGDKRLHKWLHYFDVYERHFERFRGTSPVMVEIGVAGGGSLEMWKAYLGEGSRIVGIDIDPYCKQHEKPGIEILIGSQSDPGVIDALFEKYPQIDIILDDGSHVSQHMTATFNLAYSRMQPNGVYMVEDVATSYDPAYGGGLRHPEAFIEFVKDKLDEINALYFDSGSRVSDFTRGTNYIAVYDSVVVFERRRQGRRDAPVTVAM